MDAAQQAALQQMQNNPNMVRQPDKDQGDKKAFLDTTTGKIVLVGAGGVVGAGMTYVGYQLAERGGEEVTAAVVRSGAAKSLAAFGAKNTAKAASSSVASAAFKAFGK